MPRAQWAGDAVYIAAERFVEDCLRSDGSLFTPGQGIWASPTLNDFYERFVVQEITEGGGFLERLELQLTGAEDASIQLAAEALYFNYLCEDDTGAPHKRQTVGQVLSWMSKPTTVPAELDAAYDGGLARIGLARIQKWQQVSFLLKFMRAWKALESEHRDTLLADPSEFRAFVHSVPKHSASIQVEGLLHLVFPEPFEPIVSPNVKQKIAEAFADELDGTETDVDEKLRTIRTRLADEYGEGFSFYDPELTAVWGGEPGGDLNAWLVRGAKAYGANIIPRWINEGFVSIAREEEGEAAPGSTLDEIIDTALLYYTDRTRAQMRNGALSSLRFVNKMDVGDLILTIDPNDAVYVGRITGELEWVPGDAPGTARRRAVDWLNTETPATRTDLPERLRRLLGQNSVIDLSAVADDVAALIPQVGDGLAWDGFLHWASRIYETEGFDEDEREYKLEIAEHLREAREALDAGDADWLARLRRAFGPPNNLTSWRAHYSFLADLERDPEKAAGFLSELWAADLDREDVLTDLFARWPGDNTPGNRVSLVSFLRMAVETTDAPVYRARAVSHARSLLEDPEPNGATPAQRYLGFLNVVDELRERMDRRGVKLRDRIDAQSLLWWVAQSPPPERWSEEEKEMFLRWRGDIIGEDVKAASHLAVAPLSQQLADKLLLDRGWLQEIIDLLNEKRQVILYGPPGTGKTFVAQALAEHAAGDGGVYELVQFHPAYSYEDFFEGYRPRLGATGGIEFELRPGPLRRIADQAREESDRVHVLVIDEINRGNIAKIFGELYFLLEYRDRDIQLQYSETKFSLPDNLFFIGTMNTADRSIALVDSALRRRFYFQPFLPRDEPLLSLLGRWLDREEYPRDSADYLKALNEALARAGESDEFAIGPSYFITRDGPPDIGLVWRHAIAPLLEERFYGARSLGEIESQFSPTSLSSTPDDAPT